MFDGSLLSHTGDSLLFVAVSGGVDSVCLLHAISQGVPKTRLHILHYDHRVRQNSERDAAFVKQLAVDLGLEVTCQTSPFQGQRSETALREERYAFFQRMLESQQNSFVVLAHHGEDQLETYWMRLIRGTGIRGSCGMRFQRDRFLRPLLGISKSTILQYAQRNKLKFSEDETNASRLYFRNRVRQDLLPPLKQLSNQHGGWDAFVRRFQAFSEEMANLADHRDAVLAALCERLVTRTALFWRVAWSDWADLETSVKGAVLRFIVESLSEKPYCRKDIRRIEASLIQKKAHSALYGLQVSYSCGYLYFQTRAQVEAHHRVVLTTQPPFFSVAGLGLSGSSNLENAVCRFFQNGDRCGKKKMKEIFLECGVPKLERPLLPMAARPGRGDVVWFFPQKNPKVTILSSSFPFAVTSVSAVS